MEEAKSEELEKMLHRTKDVDTEHEKTRKASENKISEGTKKTDESEKTRTGPKVKQVRNIQNMKE